MKRLLFCFAAVASTLFVAGALHAQVINLAPTSSIALDRNGDSILVDVNGFLVPDMVVDGTTGAITDLMGNFGTGGTGNNVLGTPFQFAIRERAATQQATQPERIINSFIDFDFSGVSAADVGTAIFQIDHVGQLNTANGGFVVEVSDASQFTNLNTGSLGTLQTAPGTNLTINTGTATPATNDVFVDITAFVNANLGSTATLVLSGNSIPQSAFFNNAEVIITAPAVPEPSSAALVAFGLAGVALRRRRQ